MAIVKQAQNNFASFVGTPPSNTEWERLYFDYNFKHIKLTVTVAPLEFSINGKDSNGTFPIGVHDLFDINLSTIYVRKTTSVIQLYAYGSA